MPSGFVVGDPSRGSRCKQKRNGNPKKAEACGFIYDATVAEADLETEAARPALLEDKPAFAPLDRVKRVRAKFPLPSDSISFSHD